MKPTRGRSTMWNRLRRVVLLAATAQAFLAPTPRSTPRVPPVHFFDKLAESIKSATDLLSGKSRMTEANTASAIRDVRRALLDADVSKVVVDGLVERVRANALDGDVAEGAASASFYRVAAAPRAGRGYFVRRSRRRRGRDADIFREAVATPPRLGRGYFVRRPRRRRPVPAVRQGRLRRAQARPRAGRRSSTCRGDAAAAAWIVRGRGSCHRGRDAGPLDRCARAQVMGGDDPALLEGGEGEQRIRAELAYFGRVDIRQTGRGPAAAATWIFCGDELRRRRGCHVDII